MPLTTRRLFMAIRCTVTPRDSMAPANISSTASPFTLQKGFFFIISKYILKHFWKWMKKRWNCAKPSWKCTHSLAIFLTARAASSAHTSRLRSVKRTCVSGWRSGGHCWCLQIERWMLDLWTLFVDHHYRMWVQTKWEICARTNTPLQRCLPLV